MQYIKKMRLIFFLFLKKNEIDVYV